MKEGASGQGAEDRPEAGVNRVVSVWVCVRAGESD